MSMVAAAVFGAALGAKHAFEADHIAAVCTFVARGGGVRRAAQAGALWGAGHAAIIVLGGGALVLTGTVVPPRLALALDVAVAVLLVALGALSIAHRKDHDGPHDHHAEEHAEAMARRPLAVGLVHGASGTAALTLLVATTIADRAQALAFVAVFGLASIVAMTSVAALIAWPLQRAVLRLPALAAHARGLAGAGSIAAGIAVGYAALGA